MLYLVVYGRSGKVLGATFSDEALAASRMGWAEGQMNRPLPNHDPFEFAGMFQVGEDLVVEPVKVSLGSAPPRQSEPAHSKGRPVPESASPAFSARR